MVLRKLSLEIPATSANLGPGFDCLGLALNLKNQFSFQENKTGYQIVMHAAQGIILPETFNQPDQNLVIQSYQKTCKKHDWEEVFFDLDCQVFIPLESGLGSSATAIVAGVTIAYALHDQKLDRAKILEDCLDLENHPDNLVAAIYGGFTCAFRGDKACQLVKADVEEDLKIFILHPALRVNTEKSRKNLPEKVLRVQAVQTLGRAVTFVAAFLKKQYSLFFEAMEDFLHEPYRIDPKMRYPSLKKQLQGDDFYGWCMSGSGPSLLIFCREHSVRIENLLKNHFRNLQIPATIHKLQVDNVGLTYHIEPNF